MTEESLFTAALDRPSPAERRAFLVQACGDDRDLLRRLDRLLAAHDHTSGILDAERSCVPDTPPLTGAVVAGRYRLLNLLGEGGMGSVWLAEQTEPMRRQVALKLIKPGMDSHAVLARFEVERQALALMDHPHIAKVFDGGTTADGYRPSAIGQSDGGEILADSRQPIADGRPFFVMEYVRGVPLTTYCDAERLDVTQRLRLFVAICQAVQHAHQKGIVHRDLKPSNILVTRQGAPADDSRTAGPPVPKIIDFGLAKALHQPLTERMVHTAVGMMLGTPLYMSPEQAEFNNLDIDTRADIYTLGVILYELLAGSPPFTHEELRTVAFTEMLRIIKEVDPAKPSTRLSSVTDVAAVAANRGLDSKHLKKLVSGELDWIVMKCLEKERNRRYATANALAADVLRYLADEPVEAGPPSAGYRMRKFLHRNRGPVLAAAAIVVLLLCGIIGTTGAMIEVQHQRDDAKRAWQRESQQRERAELAEGIAKTDRDRAIEAEDDTRAFSDFLVHHVLAASRPEGVQEGIGVDVRMSQALEVAEQQIERVFHGRPRAEAEARHALGVTWRNLGRYADAERNLRRAVDLRQQTLGSSHGFTLNSMNSLAVALDEAGKTKEAIRLFEHLRKQAATTSSESHEPLRILDNLARAYRRSSQFPESIALLEEVRAARVASQGPNHPSTLNTMHNLAMTYRDAGKLRDAIRLFEQVRDVRLPRQPDHPDTLATLENLGVAYRLSGRVKEAIPLHESVWPKQVARFGREHPNALSSQSALAVAYRDDRRLPEAIRMLEEVRDLHIAAQGLEHRNTLSTLNNLAVAYLADGRAPEAIRLLEQVRSIRLVNPGPEHRQTLNTGVDLTNALRHGKEYERARALGEELLPLVRRILGPDHQTLAALHSHLGYIYSELRAYEKAAEMQRALVAHERSKQPLNRLRLAFHLGGLAGTLLQVGQFAEAETVLRECLCIREQEEPSSWRTFQTMSMLGGALVGQQQCAAAEPLLLQGQEGLKQRAGEIPSQTRVLRQRESLLRLVKLYDAWGKPEEAAKWRKELDKFKSER